MSIKEITRDLLRLEHWNYALQLGMVEGDKRQLDEALLKRAVYAIDELRWQEDTFSHRLATQLIAITWEHSSPGQRQALREYFIVTLSRLGIAPSTGMIDREFADSGVYSPVSSFFTELQTITLQAQHEINIAHSRFLLTQFQFGVLSAIREHRLIGISAPTSAGKSFAIYLLLGNSESRLKQRSIRYLYRAYFKLGKPSFSRHQGYIEENRHQEAPSLYHLSP